jgi:hypothetical protein
MSIRNNSTKKKRILTYSSVAALSVVAVSAMFFVGYKGRFFFILPGFGFIMFTVVAIGIFCQACCDIISRRWPETVGFIRSSKIVKSFAGGSQVGNSSHTYTYSIDVEYEYSVGSKRYKGRRISFFQEDYSSWNEAHCAKSRFQKNKNTTVYYCPQIPSVSCIAHTPTRDIVIGLSAAVGASAVSLIFTLLTYYYLP